jgi:ABC-type transporter Mla MlaB component
VAISPYLVITTEQHGRQLVLRLRGELDVSNVDSLRQVLDGLLERAPHTLAVDLAELGFADCAGLSVFLAAHARLAARPSAHLDECPAGGPAAAGRHRPRHDRPAQRLAGARRRPPRECSRVSIATRLEGVLCRRCSRRNSAGSHFVNVLSVKVRTDMIIRFQRVSSRACQLYLAERRPTSTAGSGRARVSDRRTPQGRLLNRCPVVLLAVGQAPVVPLAAALLSIAAAARLARRGAWPRP